MTYSCSCTITRSTTPRQSADNKKHIEIRLLDAAEPIIKAGIRTQKEFAKHILTGLSDEEKRICKDVFTKICINADEYLKRNTE